jgi:hypothetical protein
MATVALHQRLDGRGTMNTTVICALSAIFGLTASVAHASDPAALAKTTVEKALTQPLADREGRGSRFSRISPAALRRTVRIVDPSAHRDARRSEFFAFSIDEQHGWQPVLSKDVFTGCVYPKSGEVFVKRGDAHYPAGLLLGKTSKKAEPQVCVEAKVEVAQGGQHGLTP